MTKLSEKYDTPEMAAAAAREEVRQAETEMGREWDPDTDGRFVILEKDGRHFFTSEALAEFEIGASRSGLLVP